jgi:phospholipid N-methyltransferase
MNLLHILKSEPDDNTKRLMRILSEGHETSQVSLYEGDPDYERLIDQIFENDKVISWW